MIVLVALHMLQVIVDGAYRAPRGLDGLEVEIRNEKEVWVKFQNFQTGHARKIPVA